VNDPGQPQAGGRQIAQLALIVVVVQAAAVPLVSAIAGSADIADAALAWLRIAILGAPAILVSLAGNGWLRGVQDTSPASVLAAIAVPWWFLVAQLPFAGVIFALDGVLLGAGDAAFMRTTTAVSALVGFLPLTWLSLVFGWGLAGIWAGLSMFIVLRLIFVGRRAVSGRWAFTGA